MEYKRLNIFFEKYSMMNRYIRMVLLIASFVSVQALSAVDFRSTTPLPTQSSVSMYSPTRTYFSGTIRTFSPHSITTTQSFVSADEYLAGQTGRVIRRTGEYTEETPPDPNAGLPPTNANKLPVGDGYIILLLLLVGYVAYRKRVSITG